MASKALAVGLAMAVAAMIGTGAGAAETRLVDSHDHEIGPVLGLFLLPADGQEAALVALGLGERRLAIEATAAGFYPPPGLFHPIGLPRRGLCHP